MKYAIEEDGIYKVEIKGNVTLKTLLVPKDIVLEAAKRYLTYETPSLMKGKGGP